MSGGPEGTPTANRVEEFLRERRQGREQGQRISEPPVSECFGHMFSFINGYNKSAPERNRPPLTADKVQEEFNRFKAGQLARLRQGGIVVEDYGLVDIILVGETQLQLRDIEDDYKPLPQRNAEIKKLVNALGWLVHAAGTGSTHPTS